MSSTICRQITLYKKNGAKQNYLLIKIHSPQQCIYFMAGYVVKMSILVPNINRRGQKGSSSKVRHKAYASR